MANVKHAIVRTDNMSATRDGSLIVSGRFYNADETAPIDNGNVVVIGDYDKGEREVRKVTVPTGTEKISEIGLVTTPELIYDESTHHGFEDFVNEAGKEVIVLRFHANDIFSVTAEAFDGEPAKDKYAVVGNTTKIKVADSATGTVIGKIVEVEKVGPDTYFAIQVTL